MIQGRRVRNGRRIWLPFSTLPGGLWRYPRFPMLRTTVVRRALLAAFASATLAAGSDGLPRRRPKPAQAPPQAGSGSLAAAERISLDLKDADLKDVLLTFGKLSGWNIVIDPEVKGSVTVSLHDVPWEQALEVILRTNGLGFVLERNVARVGEPRKMIPAVPAD